MLDQLIPTPRLLEFDQAEVSAPPEELWERLRHGDLARPPLVRALFALRTLPDRIRRRPASPKLSVDDLVSTVERPGFQLLVEEPPREFTVGAIGKVWQPQITFVHVDGAAAFAAFEEPGFVKVAWSVRLKPRGELCRVELELRVDTTDAASYAKFRRYFRLVGPASRFIRRAVLADLARELGSPETSRHARGTVLAGALRARAMLRRRGSSQDVTSAPRTPTPRIALQDESLPD